MNIPAAILLAIIAIIGLVLMIVGIRVAILVEMEKLPYTEFNILLCFLAAIPRFPMLAGGTVGAIMYLSAPFPDGNWPHNFEL